VVQKVNYYSLEECGEWIIWLLVFADHQCSKVEKTEKETAQEY